MNMSTFHGKTIMPHISLFSVLLANNDNGLYLEDALNSVFRQTYHNWEIIIVDDCSTDNSSGLYKKYENDSRIHIYYNDNNFKYIVNVLHLMMKVPFFSISSPHKTFI